MSRIRRLTVEGRRAGEGYWAPDGKRIVFQSEREPGNPFYQIYAVDLTSGDTVRISPGMGKTTCSFFRPGSDQILFASTHHDPKSKQLQDDELAFRASGKERRYAWDYDPEMEIYTYAEKTKALTRLTNARGYDAEASYSPDGQWIAFSSMRDAYNRTLSDAEKKQLEVDPSFYGEIYIMKADGSGQKRLTNVNGYDGGPFFSPDGKRIVWRRFNESGLIADVWTMNLDGTDARQVTHFGAMSWAPYIHPSGEYLLFASNKLGFENFEVYMVDMAGTKEPVRITYSDGFDGLPVPSPDGKQIAWTSSRGGGREGQIFLAQWNHEAAMKALAAAPYASRSQGRRRITKASKARRRSNDIAVPLQVRRRGAAFLIGLLLGPALPSQSQTTAAPSKTRAHVETLASDKFEGRLAGSSGERLASDYIAGELARIGAKPLPGQADLFEPFDFTAGTKDAGSTLSIAASGAPRRFDSTQHVQALSFSDSAEVSGSVVFAGYGLVVPESQNFGYDSYAGLDVKDKIVLVLRYFPEDADQKTRSILARYSDLRYKAMAARQRGAKAMLVLAGPRSPNAGAIDPDDLRYGARRIGHRRGQHQW